uniref:Uncharacterized protein n=1 Tax=Bartonella schoenbuchensis (strain DSM 13525 / NCTC 13165 / R1) TaxID=687861 RepID=E6Z1C9_BARSR
MRAAVWCGAKEWEGYRGKGWKMRGECLEGALWGRRVVDYGR